MSAERNGHNCLRNWNRQCKTKAQESICSCRLPLQRLPLYTTATHLCPYFKVVIVCSCNPGIRPSLGVRREEILNLRWEVGEREKFLSLRCLPILLLLVAAVLISSHNVCMEGQSTAWRDKNSCMGEHYKNEVSQSENIYYVTICGYLFRLLKIYVLSCLACFVLNCLCLLWFTIKLLIL